MEKRAGNRTLLRKKKRLEREKKRRIEQANRMLIPANKKTKQSLGILSFDPKGVFRFKENRWMKVFELNENALREIVKRSPMLRGRVRITMHKRKAGEKQTCFLTLMETGEIYEEIRKQFKGDETLLKKEDLLRQLSINEIMNQIAANFQKKLRFSYASNVRGKKDMKAECFQKVTEHTDQVLFGNRQGECFLTFSFPKEGRGSLIEKLDQLGCEYYLCMDLNALSVEEQLDFKHALEKKYNKRLPLDQGKEFVNASLTILLLSDSQDAKKIVEETLKNLMRSEGILIAAAFDAQGAYLESVFSLGLCEKSLSRNTEVAVVKAMLGGEENEAAKIKV